MNTRQKNLKAYSEKRAVKKVKTRKIKSPFVEGGRGLVITKVEPMIINVTLPDGRVITNPDQFPDEEYTNYSPMIMAP